MKHSIIKPTKSFFILFHDLLIDRIYLRLDNPLVGCLDKKLVKNLKTKMTWNVRNQLIEYNTKLMEEALRTSRLELRRFKNEAHDN